MEVYKITSIDTGKIYIGSTKQDKYARWSKQGWSHLATADSGSDRPLYCDIRKYGESRFTLETIELVDNVDELEAREDYWIKHYWDSLGPDHLYNMYRGVRISGDGMQLVTPEARAKRNSTMLDRYGTLFKVDQAGVMKRTATHQSNHTAIYSYEAFKNRSGHYQLPDCTIKYGLTELLEYMQSIGYEITHSQLNHWVNGGYLSKRMQAKYPSLLNYRIIRLDSKGGGANEYES